MRRVYRTTSAQETKQAAADLIREFGSQKRAQALVFALEGSLGAGKTNFVQGAAAALGVQRTVSSPTFVLLKRYDIAVERPEVARRLRIAALFHFDCFRVHSPEEIEELGWTDIVSDPAHVVFIEWPEKIRGLLPPHTVRVLFEEKSDNKRMLTVTVETNK